VLGLAAALLTSAGVTFLVVLLLELLRRAFEEYQARYVTISLRAFSDMFLFLDPRQLVVMNAVALLALAAGGCWIGGPVVGTLAGTVGFFAPAIAVRLYRRRRRSSFDAQLTDALQQMANALRAGLTFQQAAEQVARESNAPLGQELGLYTKEVRLGISAEEALVAMARRVGSEDLELVAISTNIARQLGGNLADMFETIAETIRERFRLEGKIRALTSQGKMQGMIVATLPLWVGLFLDWYRPDLMRPMFEHAYGYVLVGAIALLEAIGFVLIRRIVNIDV
jgi:tight adherence protein B